LKAAVFHGDVHVNGTVTQTSDLRLKTDVRELREEYRTNESALQKVLRMKPITYRFDKEKARRYGMQEDTCLHVGLGAQELEKIVPEAVSEITVRAHKAGTDATKGEGQGPDPFAGDDDAELDTIKTIEYSALIPVLIAAIQEQQEDIQRLKRQLFMD
jgi:hypothetical protein